MMSTSNKTFIFAIVFGLLLASASIGYYIYHWTQLESDIVELEESISQLNRSIIKLSDEDLSLSTKKLVRQFVHSQLQHCGEATPLYGNLKAVDRHLNSKDEEAKIVLFEIKRPKAHVTPSHSRNIYSSNDTNILSYWSHEEAAGITYVCHGVKFHDHTFFVVGKTGYYNIYSQIKYKYKTKEKPTLHHHLTYLIPGGEKIDESVKLFENTYYLGDSAEEENVWREQISHQSGVLHFDKGDRLYVTSQSGKNTKIMRDKDTDSYFGLFMV